ncbi:MAG: flagellar export chaperone FliS [Sphingobacteriia bacterium]|nr:flagellar export chaperone FliS [Sphingobacteriia bacterium]NCC41937.1 flagellar export chaperone FliS [Gammaproteobacteria bacterium]
MFGGARQNPAAAYTRVALETGVDTGDPHHLILMLYDGALLQIGIARCALERGEAPAKGAAIGKAIQIILDGLKLCLDMESGGELSQRLAALYDYMAERLIHANRHNSLPALDEVHGLLTTLREAWAEMKSG